MPGEPAVEHRSGAKWKVALRLLVSAAFLAVLITRVPDLGDSIPSDHHLRTAILLSAAVATMLLGIVLSAWRWQEVLHVFDAPVTLRTLTGHHLAGQFVGNVLPSTIGGDVLRVARASKTIGSTTTAFASVVLERLSGMLALPMLVVVGFAVRPSLLHEDHAWFALLVAALTLTVLGLILFAAGHPAIAGRYATNENWTRFIGAVFQGIDRARREPRRIVRVLVAALVYQVTIVASYVLIFHALDAHVSIAAAFAFIPAVSMLQALPISLGGLGVREGALVLFRHGLEVTSGVAATAGLLWYGSLVIVSMLGAPIVAVGMRAKAPVDETDDASAGLAS
ncbi:MAG: glycosyltransferase 2 family protein [Actinomycetota bacterium]|nr:glycosyltransferase 2 family protein [Actinomycetota bacterium]